MWMKRVPQILLSLSPLLAFWHLYGDYH
jgi:hypothetical protein